VKYRCREAKKPQYDIVAVVLHGSVWFRGHRLTFRWSHPLWLSFGIGVVVLGTGVKGMRVLTFVRNAPIVWQVVLLKHVSLGKAEFVETRRDLLANWTILLALDLCNDLCNV
jgi:hypothetical protein